MLKSNRRPDGSLSPSLRLPRKEEAVLRPPTVPPLLPAAASYWSNKYSLQAAVLVFCLPAPSSDSAHVCNSS